jgi:hypothetical protein
MNLNFLRFGMSSERMGNVFTERDNNNSWPYRRTRLSRFAGWLRKKLHRCYGADDWHGNMAAILSEPPWLKAVWRWCGVPFIGFDRIHTPYIASFYTKEVRKVDGVWYCDTTYTPPPFLDLRQIILDNPLRESVPMGGPQFITNGVADYSSKSAHRLREKYLPNENCPSVDVKEKPMP